MAEFLGTAVLTLVVLGVSKSNIGIPYFIALAAGLTIAAGTLVFGRVSGAHFNPAITLGLWSARRVKTLPALVYVAAQLLGSIAAYMLYVYFVKTSWPNAGDFDSRILVAETVGTFIFALGWAAAVYNRLESGKAAFVVGSSLALGIFVASVASAGLLNPALALGTRNWEWATYVLGPILGAVIAFNLYALLFAPVEELRPSSASANVKEPKAAKPAKKKK
ncbi:MAG TPA: aquaporin [Candidatus Saccharimonadales bacterium]|nr:aquaporin [Candidatus Saccharimonadales bacterium]